MFGRKKKKDKKHKPGMTDAEMSKLDEVAARRGFFNVKKSTSKKEEQRVSPSNSSLVA